MITNIKLDGDRFTVFATINGNEETMTFMPEVIATDIKNWVAERQAYYNDLEVKRVAILDELKELE